MDVNGADFTLTFRRLCDAASDPTYDADVRILFSDPSAYDSWAAVWRDRLANETALPEERVASMRRASPTFIPRNHLVQAVIEAAVNCQDFQPFEDLLSVVTHLYNDLPDMGRYSTPARSEEQVCKTFCGT
jgi:uncharacterized protein YdiU (UPF0061 family)